MRRIVIEINERDNGDNTATEITVECVGDGHETEGEVSASDFYMKSLRALTREVSEEFQNQIKNAPDGGWIVEQGLNEKEGSQDGD